VLCNVVVAVSFGLLYWLSIRAQQAVQLFKYWQERDKFISWCRPDQVIVLFFKMCDYPYEPAGILLALLMIVGAVAWWRARKVRTLGILTVPIGLLIAAAMLHQHPFGGHRLTLFMAPVIFLLAGAGVETLPRLAQNAIGKWWALVPAALVGWGVGLAGFHLLLPRTRDHIRPAIQYMLQNYHEGDGIYTPKREEFLCYWHGTLKNVRFELDRETAIPFQRFWIVSSLSPRKGLKEIDKELSAAQAVALQGRAFVVRGGAAIPFERKPN
jgi:hypothetical protein